MADAVDGLQDPSASRVASRLADAGVLAARGNSGMMMSHFFLGFAEGLDGQDRAMPRDLAVAMLRASDSLYQAVEQPIEGTILTVVRESIEEVERRWQTTDDLGALARHMLAAARESLERTPDLLPTLRDANVVDAGGLGFVRFLEGVVGLTNGESLPTADITADLQLPDAVAAARFPEGEDGSFRYCTEFIVHGSPPPERLQLTQAITGLGNSLIVTRGHSVAKVHIHTDEPARVEQALSDVGGPVDRVKIEDMRAQHRQRQRATRAARVALVTDSTCDLPADKLIEHDITVVPLTVLFGDQALLDQVEISHEELVERLEDPGEPQPTTSQPSPAEFDRCFKRAAEHSDHLLGLFVAGSLSGTLGQAQAAASRFRHASVRAEDSRSASLGLGFQVLRAAELAREGRSVDEIAAELERIRANSGLLLTVDTLKYLKRSGRLGKAKAFLGGLLDLKPILSVDADGVLIPVDRARGRAALQGRVIDLLREMVPAERTKLRMGVGHVACRGLADELARVLEGEFRPDETVVSPAAGVLAAHLGPGAWGVFYQAE
jgi:DegV family protein with EDD domain